MGAITYECRGIGIVELRNEGDSDKGYHSSPT